MTAALVSRAMTLKRAGQKHSRSAAACAAALLALKLAPAAAAELATAHPESIEAPLQPAVAEHINSAAAFPTASCPVVATMPYVQKAPAGFVLPTPTAATFPEMSQLAGSPNAPVHIWLLPLQLLLLQLLLLLAVLVLTMQLQLLQLLLHIPRDSTGP